MTERVPTLLVSGGHQFSAFAATEDDLIYCEHGGYGPTPIKMSHRTH